MTVDLSALVRNWLTLKQHAQGDIGATVKANAYGLGVDKVAKALAQAGCKTFFVATTSEGLNLRTILPEASIYVFSGIRSVDLDIYKTHNLLPVLNSAEQVALWAGTHPPPGAALHVDTAMNRLGCNRDDVAALLAQPEHLKEAGVEILMSHLACADDPEHPVNEKQAQDFKALHTRLPHLKTSLSNSAGALNHIIAQNDLARPGIGLYGGNPHPQNAMSLENVITVTAPILQQRTVRKGESVGYGSDFAASQDMRTATIGIGYADGIPRRVFGRAKVMIDGKPCDVVGRISMDSLVADISALDDPLASSEAEVIGTYTVNDIAVWAGTISYEILTGLGQRLQRRYITPYA